MLRTLKEDRQGDEHQLGEWQGTCSLTEAVDKDRRWPSKRWCIATAYGPGDKTGDYEWWTPVNTCRHK